MEIKSSGQSALDVFETEVSEFVRGIRITVPPNKVYKHQRDIYM